MKSVIASSILAILVGVALFQAPCIVPALDTSNAEFFDYIVVGAGGSGCPFTQTILEKGLGKDFNIPRKVYWTRYFVRLNERT